MGIERSLVEAWGLHDVRVIRRFASRRNTVVLVRTEGDRFGSREVVIKRYHGRPGCREREADLLRRLGTGGPRVPELYHEGREMIALEHVRGGTLVDFLEREEDRGTGGVPGTRVRAVLRALVGWFGAFYPVVAGCAAPRMIFGDVNMRNFIVEGTGIAGLDLEQAGPGRRVEDIGRLCAFALTYDPAFTGWKRKLVVEMVDRFCGELGLDRAGVRREIGAGLEGIAARRGFDPPAPWMRFADNV